MVSLSSQRGRNKVSVMDIHEETDQEDERFREAIKRAAYETDGDLYEVVAYLSEISKQRHREIFARHCASNPKTLQ